MDSYFAIATVKVGGDSSGFQMNVNLGAAGETLEQACDVIVNAVREFITSAVIKFVSSPPVEVTIRFTSIWSADFAWSDPVGHEFELEELLSSDTIIVALRGTLEVFQEGDPLPNPPMAPEGGK